MDIAFCVTVVGISELTMRSNIVKLTYICLMERCWLQILTKLPMIWKQLEYKGYTQRLLVELTQAKLIEVHGGWHFQRSKIWSNNVPKCQDPPQRPTTFNTLQGSQ